MNKNTAQMNNIDTLHTYKDKNGTPDREVKNLLSRVLCLEIISLECVVYRGEVAGIRVEGLEGQLGIYPGHAPLITLLTPGKLSCTINGGKKDFDIGKGILKCESNQVLVLTESASECLLIANQEEENQNTDDEHKQEHK